MSPKQKNNTERINVFFSTKIISILKEEATVRGISVSGLVRMIVMEWVRKECKNGDS